MTLGGLSLSNFLFGIINLIVGFIALLLTPIDNLILSLLPDLSNALTAIGSYLNIIAGSIGWAISLSGLSSSTISLIITYYVFKLTAPITFYLIKLAVAWYNKLKV